MIDKIEGFKNACFECLDTFSIHQLRNYGREIGVDTPTKKKKEDLVADIVAILAGELAPITRSRRGAPVKNERVDPLLERAIAKLRYVWFAGIEPPVKLTHFESQMPPNVLTVSSTDNTMTFEEYHSQRIFEGQLEVIDDIPSLIALSGDLEEERLAVSIELIRKYELREGDVITCHVFEKMGVMAAKNILTINGLVAGTSTRFIYDTENMGYPREKIVFNADKNQTPVAKYMDYILPLGYGQRCLVASAPKAGKSIFLRDMAKVLSVGAGNRKVLALLIDQSPELIASYQRFMQPDCLVATTFEAEAEQHVFAAELLLKRAKRYAEMSYDVVLIVDSLSKIAKAYNDTEDSVGGKTLPCGLETKTVHYIKKYLGSARAFEKKGSLTVIGSVGFGTGDILDDVLYSELSSVANAEIRLSDSLAKRRLFPAVDVAASYSDAVESVLSAEARLAETKFRTKILSTAEADGGQAFLLECANFDEFCQKLK